MIFSKKPKQQEEPADVNEQAGTAAPQEDAAQSEADPNTFENIPLDTLTKLCKEKICPTCPAAAEAADVKLRSLAELENVKKRLFKEKEEQAKYAEESLLGDLLPVLDNLDLAIQYGSADPACKNLLVGVDMTRKIFLDTLKAHGLVPVGAVSEAFDPELHEAVMQEPHDDCEPGTIVTVHQKGYRLKERTIRAAKVVVSCKKED